jgi:hypothetical protein
VRVRSAAGRQKQLSYIAIAIYIYICIIYIYIYIITINYLAELSRHAGAAAKRCQATGLDAETFFTKAEACVVSGSYREAASLLALGVAAGVLAPDAAGVGAPDTAGVGAADFGPLVASWNTRNTTPGCQRQRASEE